MMEKYSINLQWSDEDGGYIAEIPELPGLNAFGETASEAMAELQQAMVAYLQVLEEDGEIAPDPILHCEYSGQLRLRMPKSLHGALAKSATREGVSLNSYILYLLGTRHERDRLSAFVEKMSDEQERVASLVSLLTNSSSVVFPVGTSGAKPDYFVFSQSGVSRVEQ